VTRPRPAWWLPLAATFGAGIVRVLAATWRYSVADAPEYTAANARGERFVYAFWHSGLLPLALLHRHGCCRSRCCTGTRASPCS